MSVSDRPLAATALSLTAIAIAGAAAGASCGNNGDSAEPASVVAPPPTDGDADIGPDSPVSSPFGLDARASNTTCNVPDRPPSAAPIKVERVFANVQLTSPVMLAQMPGDTTRMFVALRGTTEGGMGDIVSFPVVNPPNIPTVVGGVGPLVWVTAGEGGFLGMAFDPKCTPSRCRLFVSYVGSPKNGFVSSRSVIAYLTSTDNGATFTNLTEVLGFEESGGNAHRGGGIAFGKDGFLYASFGDGDGDNDGYIVGQSKTKMSSKVLRLDVDNVPVGQTYGIPADNPFKNGGGEPTAYAFGFRNPFRFSFDRQTGDLWLGDVGQNMWEEIDRVELGGNYGWPCREGTHPYLEGDLTKCPSKLGLIDPVVEHEHVMAQARSITGGVVYRGKAIPGLVGTYVYGDYSTHEVFTLTTDPATGLAKSTVLADAPSVGWVNFAEDGDGEIYGVALETGQLHKVLPAGPPTVSTFPDRLSKTGCSDPTDVRRPAAGLVPYGVSSPLWSDGATKERYMALPDGQTIAIGTDGHFDLPIGTVLVKTFAIAGKRVETRLLMRHADGGWAGYTYEWLDDQSDALLLPSSKRKSVGAQSWYFPTRGECMRCHTEAAGLTLGLEIGQLNGDFRYDTTNRVANQLATLEHIGMFATALPKPPAELPVIPEPAGAAPLEQRARAYLHTNCSNCHRPMGGGRGNMDLRFTTTFQAAQACNVEAATGDLGIAGAKLVVPGDPSKSLVSIRAHSRALNRMPPLASSLADVGGLDVVDSWIKGLTACP